MDEMFVGQVLSCRLSRLQRWRERGDGPGQGGGGGGLEAYRLSGYGMMYIIVIAAKNVRSQFQSIEHCYNN